jgi:hypothetical protein
MLLPSPPCIECLTVCRMAGTRRHTEVIQRIKFEGICRMLTVPPAVFVLE